MHEITCALKVDGEIIIDLPIGFAINNIISLWMATCSCESSARSRAPVKGVAALSTVASDSRWTRSHATVPTISVF